MRNLAQAAVVAAAFAFSHQGIAQTTGNATVAQVAVDATKLKAAENVLTLSDGRVVVTYNGGINLSLIHI